MKRAVAIVIAGTLLLMGMSAFAQAQTAQPSSAQQGYPKEAYVKNIPLIRVFVHPLGYKLLYWKSNMTIGEMYVPLKWFHRRCHRHRGHHLWDHTGQAVRLDFVGGWEVRPHKHQRPGGHDGPHVGDP